MANVIALRGLAPFGRLAENVRECDCFLRWHWWYASNALIGTFYWIARDFDRGAYASIVFDVFIVACNLLGLWQRHARHRPRRKPAVAEKRWRDLVASWRRKPVPAFGSVSHIDNMPLVR